MNFKWIDRVFNKLTIGQHPHNVNQIEYLTEIFRGEIKRHFKRPNSFNDRLLNCAIAFILKNILQIAMFIRMCYKTFGQSLKSSHQNLFAFRITCQNLLQGRSLKKK